MKRQLRLHSYNTNIIYFFFSTVVFSLFLKIISSWYFLSSFSTFFFHSLWSCWLKKRNQQGEFKCKSSLFIFAQIPYPSLSYRLNKQNNSNLLLWGSSQSKRKTSQMKPIPFQDGFKFNLVLDTPFLIKLLYMQCYYTPNDVIYVLFHKKKRKWKTKTEWHFISFWANPVETPVLLWPPKLSNV